MNDLEQLKITQEKIEKAQSRAESYYSQATSNSLKQCLKSVLNAIENTENQIQELSKNPGIFGRVISKNSDIEKLFSILKNDVIEAHQKQSDINTNELAQFLYDLYLINSHEDLIESYANKEAYEQEVERNELLILEHQKIVNVLTQDHATETKRLRREIADLQQKFNRLNELEKFLKREKKRQKQRQIERALREKTQLKPLFLSVLAEEDNQVIVDQLSKVVQQLKNEEAALVMDDASKE